MRRHWPLLYLVPGLLVGVLPMSLFHGCASLPPVDPGYVACLASCQGGTCKQVEGVWTCVLPPPPACPATCPAGQECKDPAKGCVAIPPPECVPLNVPWCHLTTPPMTCGACRHQPPGQLCPIMAPPCVPGDPCTGVLCPEGQHCIVGVCAPDTPPPPQEGCWADEYTMQVVAGVSPELRRIVTDAQAVLGDTAGHDPKLVLERLAGQIRLGSASPPWCAFAGQEAVFVLRDDKLWEEYHAVSFVDGSLFPGGKFKYIQRGEQVAPPPGSECGLPALPPLQSINFGVEGKNWLGGTPQFHGCDYCAASGQPTLPDGRPRCDCAAWSEDDPVKRQCRERLGMGGDATFRSDGVVERNPENWLQARCSACSWISIAAADGSHETRVGQ